MTMINPEIQTLIDNICKGKKGIKLTIGTYVDGVKSIKVFDENGEITAQDYVYEIGSITKTFTASLLAKLVYEGKMSLDDSIDKYLDGLNNGKYYPTLKRLATHTAGYPTYYPLGVFEGTMLGIGLNKKQNRGVFPFSLDLEKMKKLAIESKLKDKDYKWQYSNFGYALLGHAIGVVTGKGYRDSMDEFLTEELGMNCSYTGTCEGKNLAGFDKMGRSAGNWIWNGDLTAPAGDISATARDMLEYARLNLSDEKPYLSICQEQYAHIKQGKEVSGMGLGWILSPENDYAIMTHTGGTGAFISNIAIDRNKKCAAVVMINQSVLPASIWKLSLEILESL